MHLAKSKTILARRKISRQAKSKRTPGMRRISRRVKYTRRPPQRGRVKGVTIRPKKAVRDPRRLRAYAGRRSAWRRKPPQFGDPKFESGGIAE